MKIIASIIACLALSNCAGLTSAITGQPIVSEEVTTKDGIKLNVASQDVLRAKAAPAGTVWGLYDAGFVAAQAREVLNTGK